MNNYEKSLNIDQSYCISLLKNRGNWNNILTKIHENGFPSCKIMEGIVPTDLDKKYMGVWQQYILKSGSKRHNHEHFNSIGGLGCYLSHVKIWRDMIESGYHRIAVFEEDVKFAKDRQIIKNKSDIILLGSVILTGNDDSVERFFGTQSYIITRQCVNILLESVFPVEMQIDSYISLMIKLHNLKVCNIPNITYQEEHFSTIQSNCESCHDLGSTKMKIYNTIPYVIILILVIILLKFNYTQIKNTICRF